VKSSRHTDEASAFSGGAASCCGLAPCANARLFAVRAFECDCKLLLGFHDAVSLV
jgi:hypothetical protein